MLLCEQLKHSDVVSQHDLGLNERVFSSVQATYHFIGCHLTPMFFVSRKKVRVLVSATAVLAFSSCTLLTAAETQGSNAMRRYREIWAAARSQAGSGKITYKQFINGSNFKVTDRDKVLDLYRKLAEKHGENYSELIQEFACELMGRKIPPNTKRPEWPVLSFYFDGPQTRLESYGAIEIFDGEQRIESYQARQNSDSSQITIGESPKQLRHQGISLSDFIFIPDEAMANRLVVASSSSDSDLLEIQDIGQHDGQSFKIKAAKNGDILEVTSSNKQTGSMSECIQSGFTSFGGGVRLPRSIVNTSYRELRLANIIIKTVVAAEFNIQLDEQLFKQKLKKGDFVIDSRSEVKQAVRKAKVNVENVLNAHFPSTATSSQLPSSSSRTSLFLIVNIVVALAIAALIVYRRLKMRSLSR